MMNQTLKTYELDVNPPEGMPTGVWDPVWEQPDVATRMALGTYTRIRHLPFDACSLLDADELPEYEKSDCDKRRFTLPKGENIAALKSTVKCGSFGELFKRYTFGPRPAANFHAQACCFGVDSDGRFFVDTQIGLVGVGYENEVAIAVTFFTQKGALGGVAWEGSVESNSKTHVRILGTDAHVAKHFDDISEVEVCFCAYCSGS